MDKRGKRIIVIGAGMAGICTAKHALENGMQPIIFEQTSQLGGTWVYTDNVGKDQYGLDIHSSMYKGLYTNLPKEIMGFPDFPIPDKGHSFLSREEILEFLQLYASNFEVKDRIKFEHYVIRVTPVGGEWEIIVKDLPNNRVDTYISDFVVVCNGHYSSPITPDIPGKELFKGKQLHSHYYRSPETYGDETILVIGAAASGIDIACETANIAKRVDLSHHVKDKPQTYFPARVTQRPDVARIMENGVEFADGNVQDYSMILYCTGYRYSFPFLSADCGIRVDDNYYVRPIYKHILNITYPTMAFVGLPFITSATHMIDIQARFVMRFYSGKKQLPTQQEMREDTDRDMDERWKQGYRRRQAHMLGPRQSKYYDELAKVAGIDNVRPVIVNLHDESIKRASHDISNFRKDVYKIVDDEHFQRLN